MKNRLATLIASMVDKAEGDDVLVEAANGAELTPEVAQAAIEGKAPLDPDELRALVGAIDGEADPEAAIEAARADGHVFEGDDIPLSGDDVFEAHGYLVEAPKAGSKKGRHLFVAIRPCEGQGPGARIYTAPVLKAAVEAGAFNGLPMFFNHEPMSVILARGHGSRDPRDLAGQSAASRWDPNFTTPQDAAKGYGKGAVLVEADVMPQAAELIKHLPKAVLTSINMRPKKLRAQRRSDGKLGALVESFHVGQGSLDLVTAAGAGGHYLERLQEANAARYAPGDDTPGASTFTDEQLEAAVLARPAVLDRLREAPAAHTDDNNNTEDAVSDPITKDALVEALKTDAGKAAVGEIVGAAVEAGVEARLDEVREEARAEAQADSSRALDLRDMRDEAHRAIEAAPILTATGREELRERYGLRDGGVAAPALDVFDQLDAAGNVVKPKMELLRESVATDIEREQQKLREAFPTKVRGLTPPAETPAGGAGAGGDAAAVEAAGGAQAPKIDDPLADALGMDPAAVRNYQEA